MALMAHSGNPLGIIGNESLLARLEQDIRAGHLSHAYILDGKAGSGRHTIARYIAAAIACQHRPNGGHAEAASDQIGFFDFDEPPPPPLPSPDVPLPCGICNRCRKVLEGICPDVHVIGREGKATIGVEAVRHLKTDVHMGPVELDTKIYVIEDAEAMTPQAQNALLLTLEEPPPYVLFLLLCNGADALLETIRSRAPILHTQPIPDSEIRAYLKACKKTLPDDEMNAVLLRADGCIGQALLLTDAKALKPILKQRGIADAFMEGCASRHPDCVLSAISLFGNKRDGVSELLSLITSAIRDLLLLKKSESATLKYYTDREAAIELSAAFTTRALLALYDAVVGAQDSLLRNGNVRLTLTQMCIEANVM